MTAMQNNPNKILVETVKRLLRRGATSNLRKIVNRSHAADLSIVFLSISRANQQTLFEMITDMEQKGILLSELDESTFLDLVDCIEVNELVKIFEHMPTDDIADLLGRLPDEMSRSILSKMQKEDSEEIEDLLSYGDQTAGGIMVPEFIALKESATVKEAIESLQKEHQDVEMPFYLYVLGEYGKLVGVISLRQLVVTPPDAHLKDFMTTDVFSVQTHTDQEEVAKIVARYDILAVPVVDDMNTLVGIVTVDDVIDIFRKEATEDMLKMAGVGEGFIETQSVMRSSRTRLPWLLAGCLGGIVTSYVLNYFGGTLASFTLLAPFIPVVMGMGGNIGAQSSTIVVRGLATGRLNITDIWSVIFKELFIGLILGVTYGLIIGLVAKFQYSALSLALSVGLGVMASMSIAGFIGSLVPMVFARINIDPAVATSPFMSTTVDVVSVVFYFIIATKLIGM